MYNVETGHCGDRPTYFGLVRLEAVGTFENRQVNISMSDYDLSVSLFMCPSSGDGRWADTAVHRRC
jgi:hypothetical protein